MILPDVGISTAITRLSRIAYIGMVCNFGVEVEESYVAAGLVVHNCRTLLTPVF